MPKAAMLRRCITVIVFASALASCGNIADVLCPLGNCPNMPHGRINADH